MQYPISISGSDTAHVVLGQLAKVPTGTVKVQVLRLNIGGAATDITSELTTDNATVEVAVTNLFSFDVKAQLGANYVVRFPAWESHGVYIRFYDDADTSNFAINKIIITAGEEANSTIMGPNHLTLQDISDKLAGSVNSCLVGMEYIDVADDDNQANDTINFTPWLHLGDQNADVNFLASASITIRDTEGASDIFTETSVNTKQTTLNGSIDNVVTTVTVTDGSVFANNDVIAIDDELMEITAIATNDLTVTRAHLGTTASAHTNGEATYVSGSDSNGVFSITRTDTSGLVAGNVYSIKVDITYKGDVYSSTHSINFVENNV